MAAAAVIARQMRKDRERRKNEGPKGLLGQEEEEVKVKEPEPLSKWKDPEQWNQPLIKWWLEKPAWKSREITEGDPFNLFIIVIIIFAGIIVGIQTYDGMEEDITVSTIDLIILGIFGIECILKMAAEGLATWRYWLGPDWKWNNFDFLIVVMCIPGVLTGGGGIKLLRLLRLMRLMKLIKKVPQLNMIVMGLLGGMKSIGYIMLLLFLVFYLYAIAGIMAFKGNDPWHFGDLATAHNTLFRACTLEDWTDIFYISYYGCASPLYNNGIYTSDPAQANHFGVIYCEDVAEFPVNETFVYTGNSESAAIAAIRVDFPHAPIGYGKDAPSKVITSIYWVSFIVVSALVMLSLFIGAVTMSMSEAMQTMKDEAEEKDRKRLMEKARKAREEEARKKKARQEAKEKGLRRKSSFFGMGGSKLDVGDGMSRDEKRKKARMQMILTAAFAGGEMGDLTEDESWMDAYGPLTKKYLHVCMWFKWHAEHPVFQNFITLVIILAGVMVGIQTYKSMEDNATLALLDALILAAFTFEVIIKMIGEDFSPWYYFYRPETGADGWNIFDFVVVVGSFLPGGGGMVTMLRLLRLLRVLKLIKALPELQVIVVALVGGLGSIGYIGVILFLFFYVFAIGGMLIFKENDLWHFGTLHMSLISLFRASTMEDWTDIMYINQFGCINYGYSTPSQMAMCNIGGAVEGETKFEGLSTAFFVVFVIICGLVLMTLFIGVVTTAMDEAQQDQKEEQEIMERAKEYATENGIGDEALDAYIEVFGMLDIDGGGTIEEEELKIGLQSIGKNKTDAEIRAMMNEVDEDESGEIDLAEFVEFMDVMAKKAAARRAAGLDSGSDRSASPTKDMDSSSAGGSPVKQLDPGGDAAAAAAAGGSEPPKLGGGDDGSGTGAKYNVKANKVVPMG